MSNSNLDLDLDALEPKPKTVKHQNKIYEIKPPEFGTYLKLFDVQNRLTKLDPKKAESGIEVIREFKNIVSEIAPELKDAKLNSIQTLVLIKFIFEMAMPKESKELKELGIEPAGTEKKNQDQSSDNLLS